MAKDVIFEKKNILVTGGAGFVGSHVCDQLVKGNKVICVDNFVSGHLSNIEHLLQFPDFQLVKADINDTLDLEGMKELDRFKIDLQGIQEIYNLACPTSPKDFEQYKIDTLKANTLGLVNVMDLAVKYKSKVVHASSSVVYGSRNSDDQMFDENHTAALDQMSPRACYDLGKKYAESVVNTYAEHYGLDAKIARIFRTYGPRVRLGAGEMLPDFVSSALDNKPLVIYGDDTFTTSLCYISDLVDGLVRLMDAPSSVRAVNLGSDQDMALVDVCKKIIEMTGSKSEIRFEPPLLFMTQLGLPDLALAKESMSWVPITTLEKGLEAMIDYAKAQKVLLK